MSASRLTKRELVLTEQLDEARETIRLLREALSPTEVVEYTGLKFTQVEANLVDALHYDGVRSFNYLLTRMSVAHRRDNIASPNSLRVLICRIRKKLKPFGVTIKGYLGIGFYMPADSVAILDGLRRRPRSPRRIITHPYRIPKGDGPCRPMRL